MKSSSGHSVFSKVPNVFSMFLAVAAACIMWYVVSVRDRFESQIEVNIDYYGIPHNLVVTDGLVTKIAVRLRGPETLLRSIPREKLVTAVDLSNIKKGETIVPLPNELGPSLRAFDVVDIQPPRIVVTADNVMERNVPVKAEIDNPLNGDALTVENLSVSPSTVVVRGPEETISKISSIPVIIRPDPANAGKTEIKTMALDTPSLVTSQPPSVKVQYSISSERTIISRHCTVHISGGTANHYEIKPNELTVYVQVPESLAKSSSYLKQLEVSVVPPPMEVNETRKVKLRFKVPEGMTLLNETGNEEVSITKIGK